MPILQYVSGKPLKSGTELVQLKFLSHVFFGKIPASIPAFQLHCTALSVTQVQ